MNSLNHWKKEDGYEGTLTKIHAHCCMPLGGRTAAILCFCVWIFHAHCCMLLGGRTAAILISIENKVFKQRLYYVWYVGDCG
jgi:hypothetical protein